MKKILFIILLLLVSKVSYSQYFEKHPNILGNDSNTFTGENNFLGNTGLSDTVFFLSGTDDPDSMTYIVNTSDVYLYSNIISYQKKKGGIELQLKMLDTASNPNGNNYATLSFQTFKTGFTDVAQNSYLAMFPDGRFALTNMADGGVFVRSGGHDEDVAVFDTAGTLYLPLKGKGDRTQNQQKYINPTGNNAVFGFLKLQTDTLINSQYALTVKNDFALVTGFATGVGLNLETYLGLKSNHYINASDSSLNFAGTQTNAINFIRDGAMLFQVDNDTNQIKTYDFLSANPQYFVVEGVDSLNSTDIAKFLRSTLTADIAHLYQNTTTGFAPTDGSKVRQSGLNLRLTNQENGLTILSVNGNDNLTLNANGSTTAIVGLTINSTTGALTIPRMTEAQRDALTPAAGMQIYNTTTSKFQGYTTTWVDLH